MHPQARTILAFAAVLAAFAGASSLFIIFSPSTEDASLNPIGPASSVEGGRAPGEPRLAGEGSGSSAGGFGRGAAGFRVPGDSGQAGGPAGVEQTPTGSLFRAPPFSPSPSPPFEHRGPPCPPAAGALPPSPGGRGFPA
jgi:hypothetical protein